MTAALTISVGRLQHPDHRSTVTYAPTHRDVRTLTRKTAALFPGTELVTDADGTGIYDGATEPVSVFTLLCPTPAVADSIADLIALEARYRWGQECIGASVATDSLRYPS